MKKYVKNTLIIILICIMTAYSGFWSWNYYVEQTNVPYSKIGKLLKRECSALKPYYENENAYKYTYPSELNILNPSNAHLSRLNLIGEFNGQIVQYRLEYNDTERQAVGDFPKGAHSSSINIRRYPERVIWKRYDFLTGKYTTRVSDNSELTASDKQLLEQVESKVSEFISKC